MIRARKRGKGLSNFLVVTIHTWHGLSSGCYCLCGGWWGNYCWLCISWRPQILWTKKNSLKKLLLHSSNFITVAHMEIKLGLHRWRPHIAWPTTNILLLHSSNLRLKLTVARIEIKLGTHAHYIISVTTTCFHDNHILFEQRLHSSKLTNSRLNLVRIHITSFWPHLLEHQQ